MYLLKAQYAGKDGSNPCGVTRFYNIFYVLSCFCVVNTGTQNNTTSLVLLPCLFIEIVLRVYIQSLSVFMDSYGTVVFLFMGQSGSIKMKRLDGFNVAHYAIMPYSEVFFNHHLVIFCVMTFEKNFDLTKLPCFPPK